MSGCCKDSELSLNAFQTQVVEGVGRKVNGAIRKHTEMNRFSTEEILPTESRAKPESDPTIPSFSNFPKFDLGAQISVVFTPAGALVYQWRTHAYAS